MTAAGSLRLIQARHCKKHNLASVQDSFGGCTSVDATNLEEIK
jgi:hypothetical protein